MTGEVLDLTPRCYGATRSIVLIGGGDLMLHTALVSRSAGFSVTVVLAPRHAEEVLPIAGTPTADTFAENGFPPVVMVDINKVADPSALDWAGDETLGLCFGPAWVFSDAVRACFGQGMINFHPVPAPKYLGGAHYTWQIMNGDRIGGCVLQEITKGVNVGPILRTHLFPYSVGARIPRDYFDENDRTGRAFFDQVIHDIRDDVPFTPTPLEDLVDQREHYPRLYTARNAFIDWSWTAAEIARFCVAFDVPYPGAASFLKGKAVRLSGVSLWEERSDMHPFGAGVVVRRHGDSAWIGARGGILKADGAHFDDGADAMNAFKEGARLTTPRAILEEAISYTPVFTGDGIGGD